MINNNRENKIRITTDSKYFLFVTHFDPCSWEVVRRPIIFTRSETSLHLTRIAASRIETDSDQNRSRDTAQEF